MSPRMVAFTDHTGYGDRYLISYPAPLSAPERKEGQEVRGHHQFEGVSDKPLQLALVAISVTSFRCKIDGKTAKHLPDTR